MSTAVYADYLVQRTDTCLSGTACLELRTQALPQCLGASEQWVHLAGRQHARLGQPPAQCKTKTMSSVVQSRLMGHALACAGAVTTLAFANFSAALRAGAGGGFAYAPRTADYSGAALSVDAGARQALGGRLAAVGAALEAAFGGAQDVEGALVGERAYVVQTRPQP